MDTLEIPPAQKISYPLLLCAGQEIKFKICASAPVEASIGFESKEPDFEPPEPFIYDPEASCFVIDHEAKRTAYYLVAIGNVSAEPIDITVEVTASLRERGLRLRIESFVRLLTNLFWPRQRFSQAISRPDPTQSPGPEPDDDDSSAGRGTDAWRR